MGVGRNLAVFWEKWPSWIVELLSGLLVATLSQLGPDPIYWQFLIATGLSAFYERYLDQNGWSWSDLREREVGIIAGLVLWALIKHGRI